MFAVQPYHGPERRTFVRLPYATEAFGSTLDAREGTVRVHNVSRIGLRFDAPCVLAPGTAVTLYFGDVYLREEPVCLNGRVIWVQEGSVWHATGLAIAHEGHESLVAASELFYAAIAGFSERFDAAYVRTLTE